MFLGLDLAWKVDGNNSAIAVLTGDEHAVQLKTISDELRSLLDIESFVEAHSGPTTVLAVDASHLWRLKGLRKTANLRELLHLDVATLMGHALKQYEDRLDALFCAYVAWHCWKWGSRKNEIYGCMEDGYIVVATR